MLFYLVAIPPVALLSSLPAKIQVLQLGIHGELGGVHRSNVVLPGKVGLGEQSSGTVWYGKAKYGILGWCDEAKVFSRLTSFARGCFTNTSLRGALGIQS